MCVCEDFDSWIGVKELGAANSEIECKDRVLEKGQRWLEGSREEWVSGTPPESDISST